MPTDITARAMDPSPSDPPIGAVARRALRRRLATVGVVGAGLAGVVVVAGVLTRLHETSQMKNWTAAEAVPTVAVVAPSSEGAAASLVLPGSLDAYYNAPIYSRVSGYVHAWTLDIGAPVKAGALLATIDTPELDQQLEQARADLQSAQADMRLADTTAKRWARLLSQDAVSQQETDEKAGDLAAKTAKVNAAKANVDRLVALKAFSRIVAPFDGVVTARRTDIGALVNAGSVGGGAASTSELFDVAKIDKLRLYVRVPQSDSAHIRPGLTATLTVPEYPGRVFQASLATTANAVSDASGTLLVELLVDNADRALKPGDYAEVRLNLADQATGGARVLRLPASALLFRKSGAEVAVVAADGHVQLRPVVVGQNLGPTIEIQSGVTAGDRVINNPPDSIAAGALVRVVQPGAEAGHEHP